MKFGFVGLGRMGGRIASRLATAGDLMVYDRDVARMEKLSDRAAMASSLAEVAEGRDVVGICVRDDAQVVECLDEILPQMAPGSVVMIHSTVSPQTIRDAAKRGASIGVGVVEAAVTVTRYDDADAPFVFTMTGGELEHVERLRPVIASFSTDTVHVGPLGSAMSLKIVNNLVSLVQIMVAEEAFRLAAMTSVPLETLMDVMRRNGALTPTMEKMAIRTGEAPPERAVQLNREVQASNGVKDLALVEELARTVNTATPTASFARTQYWFSMTAPGPSGAW